MSAWLFSDLSILIASVVGLLLALPVLVWAILSDWSRGRARCHRCWHSLEGVPITPVGSCICPECGKLIKSERARYRRRVRVRWALVSLVVLVPSVAGLMWPLSSGARWVKMLPDSALIWLMPQMEDPSAVPAVSTNPVGVIKPTRGMLLHRELNRRISQGALSDEQLTRARQRAIDILERRSMREDMSLHESANQLGLWMLVAREPLDDAGELRADLEALVSIRADRAFHMREAWPRDHRPHASLEISSIIPDWMGVDALALARVPEASLVQGSRLRFSPTSWGAWWDWSTGVGIPPDDARSVIFDVMLTVPAEEDDGEGRRLLWRGVVERPFEWRDSLEGCLTPLTGAEQDAFESALRERVGAALASNATVGASLLLDLTGTAGDDVAVALDLSWMLGGFDVWSTSVWHSPIEGPSQLDGARWVHSRGQVYSLTEDSPQWVLRVKGNPRLALRHPTATRYWDGELEFALVEQDAVIDGVEPRPRFEER